MITTRSGLHRTSSSSPADSDSARAPLGNDDLILAAQRDRGGHGRLRTMVKRYLQITLPQMAESSDSVAAGIGAAGTVSTCEARGGTISSGIQLPAEWLRGACRFP